MKKIVVLFAAIICILLSSCGMSREATSNSNLLQTQVVLEKKNYKVIGTVTGESHQNYWFGLGGMSKKSMTESAMSDMMKKADLMGGSRAIINVNVQYKSKMILIYNQMSAIATGTIIEFTE
jgi:uncharacterized protein YbjQ (UPF0145 family)